MNDDRSVETDEWKGRIVDALLEVRDQIATKNTWCQGADARGKDETGFMRAADNVDEEGVDQWCLRGAAKVVAFKNGMYWGMILKPVAATIRRYNLLDPRCGHQSDTSHTITNFNDTVGRPHEAIVAVLDKTISDLKGS